MGVIIQIPACVHTGSTENELNYTVLAAPCNDFTLTMVDSHRAVLFGVTYVTHTSMCTYWMCRKWWAEDGYYQHVYILDLQKMNWIILQLCYLPLLAMTSPSPWWIVTEQGWRNTYQHVYILDVQKMVSWRWLLPACVHTGSTENELNYTVLAAPCNDFTLTMVDSHTAMLFVEYGVINRSQYVYILDVQKKESWIMYMYSVRVWSHSYKLVSWQPELVLLAPPCNGFTLTMVDNHTVLFGGYGVIIQIPACVHTGCAENGELNYVDVTYPFLQWLHPHHNRAVFFGGMGAIAICIHTKWVSWLYHTSGPTNAALYMLPSP